MTEGPDRGLRSRLPALDIARGCAILAMVVYHLAWDLSYLGLVGTDIRASEAWSWLARATAASFLTIVGVSLVLAHGEGLRARAFLRRLAILAGAALLVTAATAYLFPRSFVFFGILHAIALGSVLALPFLRLPAVLAFGAALVVWLLPQVLRLDAFSAPALIWLGLGTRVPVTNDFVPVFPWFGFVLAGVGLAKSVDLARLAAGAAPAALRPLAFAGRHSLPIYLVHQPVLLGVLTLLAGFSAPRLDADARGFLNACHAQCRSVGGEASACGALCACSMDALKSEGLWASVLADRLDEGMRARVDVITRRCAGRPGAGS